jgi:hypothetical protein
MEAANSQTFEMKENTLCFDGEKRILLSKSNADGRNLWAKKIQDIHRITAVIEDGDNYYLSCEFEESAGYFLAVRRDNGSSLWYIPGRPFLCLLYEGFLFLIFIDDQDRYFLIKADRFTGARIWYHQIDPDLSEYSFKSDRILLCYVSGKEEMLSPVTGFSLKSR